MDCVFCKIISGEVPAEKLFEDGDLIIFKDIYPKAPVHLLIVPKVHIPSVAHLELGDSATIAKLIFSAKSIAQKVGLAGYKLVFNVGKEGGQEVAHLHLHLLGGWRGV